MKKESSALHAQLVRSNRNRQLISLALVAPLVLYLVVTFAVPIGAMLWQAVSDQEVKRAFPDTVAALASWDGHELPDEQTYRVLAADLKNARENETLAPAARRLNFDISGFRSCCFKPHGNCHRQICRRSKNS